MSLCLISTKNDFTSKLLRRRMQILYKVHILFLILSLTSQDVLYSKNEISNLKPISIEIISKLEKDVFIKAYISDNLPPPYNQLKSEVKSLLDEYSLISNGKLQFEFINHSIGDALYDGAESELNLYGIPDTQIQWTDNNGLRVDIAYLGLVILCDDKNETIPVVQSMSNLEFEITSWIKNVTTSNRRKIGFVNGHSELDLNKLNEIQSNLNDKYDLSSIDLKNETVDTSFYGLVILSPKNEFNEIEKFKLDQFIMNGGSIAFFIDKVYIRVSDQNIIGTEINLNLDDQLQNYGVKINNDLILDLQCSAIQTKKSDGSLEYVNYPLFPVITKIANGSPAFEKIKSVLLTFVSSLDISHETIRNIRCKPLLTTSEKSGVLKNFSSLSLQQFKNLSPREIETSFNQKSLVVGAVYSGKFKSFYFGKDTLLPSSDVKLEESMKESKLIVVCDAGFANEENKPPKENITFFTKLIDYLMDDTGLFDGF